MLILTNIAQSAVNLQPWKNAWPGPHCIATLPNDDLSATKIAALQEAGFIVFDFLPKPLSSLLIAANIVVKLEKLTNIRDSAFLFVQSKLSPSDVTELTNANRLTPKSIFFEKDENSKLNYMMFGSDVVASSAFLTFFENLDSRLDEMHTEDSIKFLKVCVGIQ